MTEDKREVESEKLLGISVVIPCLDEESSIGQAVEAAKQGIDKLGMGGEVIVVDNGCSDDSPRLARDAGARVVEEVHRGYGAALRRGFASARYDVLVMGDGDLTYDFDKLGDLVQPILDGEAEFVVGNRMNNIKPGAMPWLHRYIGNPLLSLVLRLMFHKHVVRDAHCGMRAITKRTYKQLGCVTTGMEFASEMVVRAIHCDVRMAERDIIYHPRVGESKLSSFRDGWRHLRFMMLHSPSTMLIFPGIFFWMLGLAMMLPLLFGSVVVEGRELDIHFMLMGGLFNIVGIQIITLGALAKAYAHLSGLREDWLVAFLYRKLTFERATLLALPLILLGLGLVLKIVIGWVAGGYGPLDASRPLFFGIICLVNGVQLAAASYIFSIMALPRHVDKLSYPGKTTGLPESR